MNENINDYMLSDEELEKVVGGRQREVYNDECNYTYIFDAPNGEEVGRVYNGDNVYTTGRTRTEGDYVWYQLDDGNWIIGIYIGY